MAVVHVTPDRQAEIAATARVESKVKLPKVPASGLRSTRSKSAFTLTEKVESVLASVLHALFWTWSTGVELLPL